MINYDYLYDNEKYIKTLSVDCKKERTLHYQTIPDGFILPPKNFYLEGVADAERLYIFGTHLNRKYCGY